MLSTVFMPQAITSLDVAKLPGNDIGTSWSNYSSPNTSFRNGADEKVNIVNVTVYDISKESSMKINQLNKNVNLSNHLSITVLNKNSPL